MIDRAVVTQLTITGAQRWFQLLAKSAALNYSICELFVIDTCSVQTQMTTISGAVKFITVLNCHTDFVPPRFQKIIFYLRALNSE